MVCETNLELSLACFYRFLLPFVLSETRFSKSGLSLGDFIEGNSVGRFLNKQNLKFDFFNGVKILLTVHKILPLSVVLSLFC